MCAINGFNFKDGDLVKKMNHVTRHRGPDGTGLFLDDDVSLGHNRLKIIDLSESAAQPMHSDDGDLAIIFNGEIYNFKEIKSELKNFYSFKTKSDTEVILAAYRKWGRGCVKKLNGIFAFAIWDKKERELFLARDHAGVKPLYYFYDGNKFIFSSEIKAILEHNVPRVLNMEALGRYLNVLYVPGSISMFEGIHKLPPASYAAVKDGKLTIEKYWEPAALSYIESSTSGIEKHLRERVLNSVIKQTISDRPLGLYLSGGIDSSIMLFALSKLRSNIDTFSVGFEIHEGDNDKSKFNRDFFLARRTAEIFKSNHHEVVVTPEYVADNLEKVFQHLDEPIASPTAISRFKLAEFTKQFVVVVLGGDGGDELFGGYDRYRLSYAATVYRKVLGPFSKTVSINDTLRKLNTPEGIERFKLFMFQKENLLSRFAEERIIDSENTSNFFEKYFSDMNRFKHTEEAMMNADFHTWLPGSALTLADRMTMAYGVEGRVPFLDPDIVQFAYSIPFDKKVTLLKTKKILKDAFREDLPDYLFDAPKRGWFSPGGKWLRSPNEDIYRIAREVLSEGYNQNTRRFFRWGEIEKMLVDHYERQAYYSTTLWSILAFQIWARHNKIKTHK